ncbi:exosortase B [Rubrivivax gelatinosus]|uniref:exosortase B n=1 Tax=Rubrivivax gelatinosus TaxID=28068 RepID=UPI0031F7C875
MAPVGAGRLGAPGLWMLAGLALLLVPSWTMLAQHVWLSDEQGHGPIILGVTMWLAWTRRQQLLELPQRPAPLAGWALLAAGLMLYVVGRSQSVDTIEVLAHLPILAAALLLTRGLAGLRWGLFFLFFLLFMVPLPGILVTAITSPLKQAVSSVAEYLLYQAGYPVARSGVILYVGQFQLLVADACAGLNSMFTLEALGLLYMNLVNHQSLRRNVLLALLIIPISFVANVTRVIVLVLVTYHFGDGAGQGFAHGFAGMTLFLVALVLILATDSLIGRFMPQRPPRRPA